MRNPITDLQQLVAPWEEHALRRPHDPCLHDAVENITHSWSDVLDLVNVHRHALETLHLPSQSRVALLGPPSAQWIAAIWACWSLNLVWCPLPPPIPTQRLQERLSHGEFAAQWNGAKWSRAHVDAAPHSSIAAYLIYTSGSTGEPKGVLVGPDALPDVWAAQIKMFEVNAQSVCSWMLSAAFDASISDIGVALTAGALLVIAPLPQFKRYDQWVSMMDRYCVTHIDAPPSWLNLWSHKSPPKSLRVVVAGGEPTPPTIVKAWGDCCRWINVYGPTEATICTSMEHRHPDALFDAPSIGQPMKHVIYRVVDPSTWVPSSQGELWIGGPAVALEYWNNPQLSREKFIHHDGKKWFRTGDWVTHDNGMFVFQGRLDRQIKKNGQLINLDEVEHVLNSCPHAPQVVVVCDRTQRITAFCGPSADIDQLRLWACARLPSWGIPQRWCKIDCFPTTPNGKVDKKSLEAQ